jgi:hypothetical protein
MLPAPWGKSPMCKKIEALGTANEILTSGSRKEHYRRSCDTRHRTMLVALRGPWMSHQWIKPSATSHEPGILPVRRATLRRSDRARCASALLICWRPWQLPMVRLARCPLPIPVCTLASPPALAAREPSPFAMREATRLPVVRTT